MSVDLGRTIGVAVYRNGFQFTREITLGKDRPRSWLYSIVAAEIEKWKPDIILIPFPTRFYNVMIQHAKLMGVVCLLAEKHNIHVVEVQDAQCKKVVLGNGKAKKEDIMNFYSEPSEHIADAKMFIDWYLKAVE